MTNKALSTDKPPLTDSLLGSRALSPTSFDFIDTLPFVDAHIREVTLLAGQSSGSTARGKSSAAHNQSTNHDSMTSHPALQQVASQQIIETGEASELSLAEQPSSDVVIPLSGHHVPSIEKTSLADNKNDSEGLEDYTGVDVSKIDRYGFYAHRTPRRLSTPDSSLVGTKSTTSELKFKISQRALKRASVNLGISMGTNYLEPPKTEQFSVGKEVSRSQKWMTMAKRRDVDSPFEFKQTDKLKKRVYKGIPDCWRSSAWFSLMNDPINGIKDHKLLKEYASVKNKLCAQDEQIELDVPRTISGHVLFRHRNEGGQRLLFRILHAIALQCPVSGYVQGMASVAATLLCYYTEEQAYIMLYRLWTMRGLGQLYEPGFKDLMVAFDRLERKMKFTEVGRHLLNIGCHPLGWATRWYLTVFHISVPFHTQLRIWDIMMLHDKPQEVQSHLVLEATSLALIEGIEDRLLACDFEQAMSVLTQPVEVQDDDRLIYAVRKKLR